MEIPEIDTDTAAALLADGKTLFMDVRDGGSYAAAHIPGAVHVSDENIAAFLADTDRAQKVVVYCYHGNASRGGTGYLLSNGFTDVASMSGGFEAWRGHHPHESA
ncbi:MAG: thiosulfate sulfurtransferase GlpE [Planctomycetota bacterium]|nr:MAG: thiosulfate sulfurtransferase GlpE [Planctomycetota bacterium]